VCVGGGGGGGRPPRQTTRESNNCAGIRSAGNCIGDFFVIKAVENGFSNGRA
jgi:hypothetical protein